MTESAKEAGIKYSTAVTSVVFEGYVCVPPGVEAQDERCGVWDILVMLCFASTRHPETEGDTLLIRNDNTELKPVKFKAVVHPGDDVEPIVTVMLPDED